MSRLTIAGLKLLLILACLGGAVVSANEVRVGLIARASPAAALAIDSSHPSALMRQGDLLIATAPDGSSGRRIALARLALHDEPLAATAVRQIGLALDGGAIAPSTRPYMMLANELSRREGLAQMWLAQDRFKAGDVPGGMAHIDTLLRVHPGAHELIFPLFARSGDRRGIARALAARSDAGAAWVSEYLHYELARSGDMAMVADILQSVGKPSRLREGGNIARETIRELAVAGEGARARELFRRAHATGLLGRRTAVSAGQENLTTATPWRLFGWPEAAAEWRMLDGVRVLDVLAEANARRLVAQQVRFDPPGRYRWEPKLIDPQLPAGSRVDLTFRCSAGGEATTIWSAIAGAVEDKPRVVWGTVALHDECAAPVFSLELVGPEAGGSLSVTLTGLESPPAEVTR